MLAGQCTLCPRASRAKGSRSQPYMHHARIEDEMLRHAKDAHGLSGCWRAERKLDEAAPSKRLAWTKQGSGAGSGSQEAGLATAATAHGTSSSSSPSSSSSTRPSTSAAPNSAAVENELVAPDGRLLVQVSSHLPPQGDKSARFRAKRLMGSNGIPTRRTNVSCRGQSARLRELPAGTRLHLPERQPRSRRRRRSGRRGRRRRKTRRR